MATNKRQFTMRMQQKNFDKIRVISAINKRSVAMQIEYLIEKCIAEYEDHFGEVPIATNLVSNTVVNNNLGVANLINIGVGNR